MSYLLLRQDPTLGCFGFGPGCRCSHCRENGSRRLLLGEPAAPAPAPPGPVFRLRCPAGCPPVAAAQCRTIVWRAAADAIRLCINAANKLEAQDAPTSAHFLRIFGHPPSRPVPWAGNRSSGATVAHRLRKVAEALHGRVVHFRCTCPGAPAGTNARTNAAVERNVINLCARFWNRADAGLPLSNRFFRAGVVLHEMLHLLYHEFFHHAGHPSGDPERHRDNSHCYEAFALLANGHTPEQGDLDACAARPF